MSDNEANAVEAACPVLGALAVNPRIFVRVRGKHGGQMSRLFTIKQNQHVNYAITSPVLRGL